MTDLKFHVFDYYTSNINPNEVLNDSDEDDFYDEEPKYKSFENTTEYSITMFGKTHKGETISTIVNGFPPYFYVKVPYEWNQSCLKKFLDWIQNEKRFHVYKNCIRRLTNYTTLYS